MIMQITQLDNIKSTRELLAVLTCLVEKANYKSKPATDFMIALVHRNL